MKQSLSFFLFVVVLAVIGCAIVAGGYLYFYQEAQIDSLRIGLGAQNAALKEELAELRAENAALRAEVEAAADSTDGAIQPQPTHAASPPPEPPALNLSGDMNMADMMKKLLANAPDSEGPANDVKEMMQAFEGFANNPTFSKMMLNQEYGGLFKRLGLTPEREEQLRAVLLEHYTNAMTDVFGMFEEGGAPDFEKHQQKRDEAEKAMRDAVAGVLQPDEMAVYDDYQANKFEYMQREQMHLELDYLAGQVSEQNLGQFIDLYFQNETLFDSIDPELLAPDPGMMPSEYMVRRAETLQTALDQLAPHLTPEEHAALARHVELQRMQAAQMDAMFQNMGMDEEYFREMMQGFGVENGAGDEGP